MGYYPIDDNFLKLRQANLRRWLDKRVPLTAGDVTLNEVDRATLYKMMRDGEIPLIARKDAANSYSLVVNEGKGSHHDFYVLAVDIPFNKVEHIIEEGYNLGVCELEWI